jgi:hypothetical protein
MNKQMVSIKSRIETLSRIDLKVLVVLPEKSKNDLPGHG